MAAGSVPDSNTAVDVKRQVVEALLGETDALFRQHFLQAFSDKKTQKLALLALLKSRFGDVRTEANFEWLIVSSADKLDECLAAIHSKLRSVPLGNRAVNLLRRLYKARPDGEPRVFLIRWPGCYWRKTKPQAKPFSDPHGAWDTAIERAGLKDVVIHDLRHTFASRLVQRGVPLLAVSKLLGHASVTMTLRYAHLAPGDLNDPISTLDALSGSEKKSPQNPPQQAA